MNIVFDTYQTLALASFVLLLGYFLVKRIRVLQTFNIPEPVVGGCCINDFIQSKRHFIYL